MKRLSPPLLLVPYREVRHDQPDDCIHYEPVATRGCQMNWTIPAHRHEGLHQFQMLVDGTLDGTVDGRAFAVRGPVLLMLAPGSVHGFTYSHDALGHQVSVPTASLRRLLQGSELAELALDRSFVLARPGAAQGAACAALFERIGQEFAGHAPGRVQALLALATLLAVQFLRGRGEGFAREDRPGARDTLVQRYLALIERHYREHLPLAGYATRLGVTPDHLSRSCRQARGQTALQVLHERMLLEARRLLAYTPAPVAAIAEQLGYADAAYFSRFFCRGMGHTPSAYRQLVAAGVRAAA